MCNKKYIYIKKKGKRMNMTDNSISTVRIFSTVLLIIALLLSSSITFFGNKMPSVQGQDSFVQPQSSLPPSSQTNVTTSSSNSSLQYTGMSKFANLSAAATTALVSRERTETGPLVPPAVKAQVEAQKKELQSNRLSANTASILEEKNQTVFPVDIQSALVASNATSSPNAISSAKPFGNASSTTAAGMAAPKTPQVISVPPKRNGPDQASCGGGTFPPDATVATGKDYVVVMDNLCGAIYSKTGTLLQSFALNPFFNAGSDKLRSPFVSYDLPRDRFFATVTDADLGEVIIAVSRSVGPLVDWALFVLKFTPVSHCPDQPFHATSSDKFVVSVNVFANHCEKLPNGADPPYLGASTTLINKPCLVQDNGAICYTQTTPPNRLLFSLHPVLLFGTDEKIILVSDRDGDNQHLIRMDTWSGPVPTAVDTVRFVPIFNTLIPPDAVQRGTPTLLNTNDGRITSAHETSTFLVGQPGRYIWLTFNDGCKPQGDPITRSCTRLIEIDKVTGLAIQDFDLGIKNFYLFYGALTVVHGSGISILTPGNLHVVFGASSKDLYPSLFATRQVAGAVINTVDPPILLKRGGINVSPVYGDYFGASPDPSNFVSAWLYGEYMKLPGNWGTWLNKVQ